MGKIKVEIKTSFGQIVVEGDSAQEILETMKTMTCLLYTSDAADE